MRPVIIVIDMQEHFRGMAETILRPLNALVDACHETRVPVIFTQHGHTDLDRPAEAEASSVLVRWWTAAGSIAYGSKAWQLLPELHRQPRDHVITSKHTYDAFQGTELLSLLQHHGCDTLLVGGVMTNSAFTKNFNVLFLSDGTATATKQLHAASLLNLGYGFARVLTCAEAAAAVQEAAEAPAQDASDS